MKTFVIVDPIGIGTKLAPIVSSLGFSCVSVMSPQGRAHAPHTLQHEHFVANLLSEEVDSDPQILDHYDLVGVAPGHESGVSYADVLAARLGAPAQNDALLSESRRNKYAMGEALRSAGLRTIRQHRVTSLSELLAWVRSESLGSFVVKPLQSAKADGVSFCSNDTEAEAAFRKIRDSKNVFGESNDAVLVQEDISRGTEYTVNSVSFAGRHVITDIWRMKRTRVWSTNVCVYSNLVAPLSEKRLVSYVECALDALGIRYGAAHSEVMVVDDEPVLIETGARIEGFVDPSVALLCTGYSQALLSILSLLGHAPQFTLAPYELSYEARHVYLLSQKQGVLREGPNLARFSELSSFYGLETSITKGSFVPVTNSLAACKGHGYLVHSDLHTIEQDYERWRVLEEELYASLV